jgi:hypothetical protein
MGRLMRVSLATLLVALGVWGLIAVWLNTSQYFGWYHGGELWYVLQRIAIDLAVVSGLVVIALLAYRAYERLER